MPLKSKDIALARVIVLLLVKVLAVKDVTLPQLTGLLLTNVPAVMLNAVMLSAVIVPLLVNVPSAVMVNVPVPTVRVPLFVRSMVPTGRPPPLFVLFSVTVGEFPNGSVVPLEMVNTVFPETPSPSLSITTVLNVTAEASTVAAVGVSKVIVPLLCVHVGEPVWVKLPATVIVPEVEVKVPAEIV